jgi:hypothetical protein
LGSGNPGRIYTKEAKKTKVGLGELGGLGVKTVMGRYSPAPMARHTVTINFAIGFEVIAGVTPLAVVLGALMREARYRSRETPLRPT